MRERCMEHRSNFGGGCGIGHAGEAEGTFGDVYAVRNVKIFVQVHETSFQMNRRGRQTSHPAPAQR